MRKRGQKSDAEEAGEKGTICYLGCFKLPIRLVKCMWEVNRYMLAHTYGTSMQTAVAFYMNKENLGYLTFFKESNLYQKLKAIEQISFILMVRSLLWLIQVLIE